MGGDHFYTIDEQGENCYRSNYSGEGIPGYVFRSKPDVSTPGFNAIVPIYRFFNTQIGDNFYCRDPNGENSLRMGYQKQGDTAWWMFSSQLEGTVALHRWYGNNDHFYTTDPKGESAQFLGYKYEGVLGYLYTKEQPGTVPLRRYFNGSPALPAAIWGQYVNDTRGGNAEAVTANGRNYFRLFCNGRVLYYAIKVCGTQAQPTTGYPLYICFHGGGTNTGNMPNGNDGEWWGVFDNFYATPVATQSPCVLVAARGLSAYTDGNVDTYDLHSQPESFVLLQRMIMNLMLPSAVETRNLNPRTSSFIDPNKVYLLGFSAGGNGIYQLSTKIADRCAAVVAGGGHPEWATFENLANLPICIQVGAYDEFDGYAGRLPRPPPNLAVDTKMSNLQSSYARLLYIHQTDIIQGGYHNDWAQPSVVDTDLPILNNPTSFLLDDKWSPSGDAADATKTNINSARWVAKFNRYPYPPTVIWNLASRPPLLGAVGPIAASPGKDTVYKPQNLFYWLYIRDTSASDYSATDVIQASYGMSSSKNWIKIQRPVSYLGFLLNSHMVDFSKTLMVYDWTDRLIGAVVLGPPSNTLLMETLYARGDPTMVFSKMVYLQPAGGTSWTIHTTNTLVTRNAITKL